MATAFMPPVNHRTTERPAPRLVLDTSILIMAVSRPRSKHRWLQDAWQEHRIIPLTSQTTENEFRRTLRKPALRIPGYIIPELEKAYLDYCTKIAVPEQPRHILRCRDPKDQPFLDLAYYAEAEYLVTGDDDLLDLRTASLIPIIEPAQLQALFQQGR